MQRQSTLRKADLEPHSLVKYGKVERGGGYFHWGEGKQEREREPAGNAASGNRPLPGPGSIWALINLETGESDPLKTVEIFVLKNPCQVPLSVTHKVAFRQNKTAHQ